MSDEIERLRQQMAARTPAPDGARKGADIARAMENFDRVQGSAHGARQRETRGRTGRLFDGVKTMLDTMTAKAGLAATTGIAAIAAFWIVTDQIGNMPADLRQIEPRERAAETGERAVERQTATVPAEAEEAAPLPKVSTPLRQERVDADTLGDMAGISVAEDMAANAPSHRLTVEQDTFLGSTSELARAPMAEPRVLPGVPDPVLIRPEADTEAYANAHENPVKLVAEEPVSTFSIDVDTASYAVVRSSIMGGYLPPKDAVRVEEMINYFPYDYPAPDGAHPFRPTVTVTGAPWAEGRELVHIALQGVTPAVEDRPALNLVFLIDTSGSMQSLDKLPLLKQSFRLMLGQLRPEDEVSIVTYAGSAGRVLEPTPASERGTILAALDRLEAGGSTAGQAGLVQAYDTAAGMTGEGEVTRVILATDGDFNVGLSDPEALKEFIAQKRAEGAYLSVLGFGRGNLDDATMQALAQNGNGTAAYIDTLAEARKVLVDQLTGALFPIADDVKVQVEFNPAVVSEYRLIGYETRALAREDFNNDRVDAGEIGAGRQVTAIYEIARAGSGGERVDPLRYGERTVSAGDAVELGFLKLRYKAPGEEESRLIETPIPAAQNRMAVPDDVRFSIAVAGFGQLLRGSDALGDWGYAEAAGMAAEARGSDPFGYRAAAVDLMRLAGALAE